MPRSKKPRHKKSVLVRQKNRARGLISAAKAKTYSSTEIDRESLYRGRLRATLLNAREELPIDDHDQYLKWFAEHNIPQVKSINTSPKKYLEFNWHPRSKQIPLEQELSWITSSLVREQEKISSFRRRVDQLESAVWMHRVGEVDALLDVIETEFGNSLWLIEMRIALTQHFHGLEAQKRIKDSIKKAAGRGLTAYIAHNVGVRNEPSVTPYRFIEQIQSRLDKADLKLPLKLYMRYRLTKELPAEKSGLAGILQIEQSHSVIDIYETFVAIAQHILKYEFNKNLYETISVAIEKISEIRDFRLDKVLMSLGKIRHVPQMVKLVDEARSQLLSGNVQSAYRNATKSLRAGEVYLGDIITAGYCRAFCKSNLSSKDLRGFVLERLAILFAKTEKLDVAIADLGKLALNLSGLPSVKALNGVCMQEGLPLDLDYRQPLMWLRLNSKIIEAEDLLLAKGDAYIDIQSKMRVQFGDSYALKYFDIILNGPKAEEATQLLSFDYAAAIYCLRKTDTETAFIKLHSFENGVLPRPLQIAATRLAIECYIQAGDSQKAYSLISKNVVRSDVMRHAFPIEKAASGIKWQRLLPFADKLSVPIVLDLHWREANDNPTGTMRRAAVAEFLRQHQLQKPSDITAKLDKFNMAEVIYFLKRICVPSVIDMLPALDNSKDVEIERKAICGLLIQIDKENGEEYQAEFILITRKLSIEEGLRLVNQGRVHVDADSISRWANKELKENYRRYADLVKAGIGVADNFGLVLKQLLQSEASLDAFQVPESEADELFINILRDLLSQFLVGNEHGLDSYLSRRIRHNTMHGFIRGPVERSSLITQRDKAGGTYKPNEYWLERLTALSTQQKQIVSDAFSKFAEDFDGAILHIKDNYMHVKSQDHPDGVFELAINAAIFHFMRSLVQQAQPTLDVFVATCVRLYWSLLNPSLETVRSLLKQDTKHKIAAIFGQLKTKLKDNASHDPCYAELSQEIGDANSRVIAEIEKIADWFIHYETKSGSPFSAEEMIDIGIAAALSAHPAYTPQISVAITEPHDSSLDVTFLNVIHDIMWIALDNVYHHSKIEKSPIVNVVANINAERKVLSLSIKSQIATGVRSEINEARLAQCKRDIASGAFRNQLNKEGGSGFKKLASIVLQSNTGTLEFGYSSDEEFEINLELDISVEIPPFTNELEEQREMGENHDLAFSGG